MTPQEMKIAIVCSVFNPEITGPLLEGALSRLLEIDVLRDHIKIVKVPGAIEIPLIAKLLAKSNNYQAIIALGCVVRGETSHYDYVCQQVSNGCQQVMLEHEVPIIFGVLTTDNEEQAKQRTCHPNHKGIEAADCAIEMAKLVSEIN